MNAKPKCYILVFILLILVCLYRYADSYDDVQTHPRITNRAIGSSTLNQYLVQNLGFKNGVETTLPSDSQNTVWVLLQKGSTDEDHPLCRSINHFHNPLSPWDRSYVNDEPDLITAYCLTYGGYPRKYSSITWATGYTSRSGERIARIEQQMGWDDARQYYYLALTTTREEDRDTYFAKVFQALGQVMHLLQDVSVPAHVRNDCSSHLNYSGYKTPNLMDRIGNRFEHYVKHNPVLVAAASPIYPAINQPRLSDFWDTDQYTNDNPSANLSLGVAEIINANYLSDYTIPNNNPIQKHSFTYPKIDSQETQICEDYAPGSTNKRKYVSRKSKGACPPLTEAREADHFATASLLNRDSTIRNENISSLRLWLDENVHQTYSKEILPMALGYSAGLLEYFFRGKLHVDLLVPSVNEATYNISDRNDTGRDIDRVVFFIQNNSRLNGAIEPVGDGEITLTVSYQNSQTGRTIFVPAGTATISGIPEVGNQNARIVLFTLAEAIPTQIAKDITYSLVFRGQLGNENDAVIGKVITAPVLYSVTPDRGIERDVVTISGDNLPNIAPPYTTASENIKFSHDWSMPYNVEVISKTDTEITVTVPDTAGLMKPGYGGLRLKKVVGEGQEMESIYSNPIPFYPIAQGIIRNSTESWQNVTMSALAPISGDYNPLPTPVVYQVPPNGSVGIRLMTGFTYSAAGGPGTQGTIDDIWTLTPDAIDFEFDIFP